jgi:hypothetical protein
MAYVTCPFQYFGIYTFNIVFNIFSNILYYIMYWISYSITFIRIWDYCNGIILISKRNKKMEISTNTINQHCRIHNQFDTIPNWCSKPIPKMVEENPSPLLIYKFLNGGSNNLRRFSNICFN